VPKSTISMASMASMASCLRAATVGTVLTGVLAGAGAANVPVASAATVACTRPGRPGPGYNATISNRQNGDMVCIGVGEKLLVSLSAPPKISLWWRHIHVSPPGVLTLAPLNMLVATGVTATAYRAARPGTAELSSQRLACVPPPRGTVRCGAPLRWEVTVVVVGRRPSS
jgi:hypothetical protein